MPGLDPGTHAVPHAPASNGVDRTRPTHPLMTLLRQAARPLALLLTLAAAGYALQRAGLNDAVANAGAQGPLAFILLGTLACAIGIPRQVIAYAAGLAWGFWAGTALALLAETLACAIDVYWARLLARRWATTWLARRPPESRIARLDRFLATNAFRATLTLRLLPLGSNIALNLLAGVSAVAIPPFLLASALGYIPQTVVFALLGSGVRVSGPAQLALSIALLLASIALGLTLLRRRPISG